MYLFIILLRNNTASLHETLRSHEEYNVRKRLIIKQSTWGKKAPN